ncbi:MAG: hypothetical protein BWK76_07100 [Desulfobulbaceae bacterium A2]|nr:MAG: hypothetical protein BWK76_07100 [Desulfobulbaceae bacterium A2]
MRALIADDEPAAVDDQLKPVSDERLARSMTRLRQSGSESTATLPGRPMLVLRERPETLPVSRGFTHLFRQM